MTGDTWFMVICVAVVFAGALGVLICMLGRDDAIDDTDKAGV